MFRRRLFSMIMLIAALPFAASLPVTAADHRDAPAVDGTGEGDITDVLAFLDPNNKNMLVVAMGVNPFAVGGESHSYRFSNEYLYQFKIDNTGDAKEDLVIQARFSDSPAGQMAHIRIGVPDPNMVGASNLYMENAPSQLDGLLNTVFGDPATVQVFAGLRDDPFVLDPQYFRITIPKAVGNGGPTQQVFRDLPNTPLGHLVGRSVRADGTSGIDMFAGFNASYIVVEIPVSFVSGVKDIINIWGTVSAPVAEAGSFLQFERMGHQLFNTVFIPGPLKDAFNQGIPSDDAARWSQFVPDALTTTDNDGTGNTFAGRAALLTQLGVTTSPNGAPLVLPSTFANTNKGLLRATLLPDVLRLNLTLAPTDLAVGQFGLQNGRRPGDDVFDIAVRLIRQLADFNFPPGSGIPGSGPPRAAALDVSDPRVTAVLQGTDFIRPDSTLGDLSINGNDKPFQTTFPFLAEPNGRPGDPSNVGYPSLGTPQQQ